MPELCAEAVNSSGHLAPVVFVAGNALVYPRVLVQANTSIQDTGVRDILTDLLGLQVKTGLLWVVEENDGGLVDLIVRAEPAGKADGVCFGMTKINLFFIAGRKGVNDDKGTTILASAPVSGNSFLRAIICRQLAEVITPSTSSCRIGMQSLPSIYFITLSISSSAYFNVIAQFWMNFISLTITWS